MSIARSLFAVLLVLVFSGVAEAHEFDPHIVQVRPRAEGRFDVRWSAPLETEAQIVWPAHCTSELIRRRPVTRWFEVSCEPPGLDGATLSARDLPTPNDPVLLEVLQPSGDRFQHLIRGEGARVQLPSHSELDPIVVVQDYFALGVEHLIFGPDHLLFLLGLLGLARGRRALLAAVTAFTVGHAMTLCLATLDLVRLAPAPVEACIALSLVWMARELVVRDPKSLSARAPWLVAGGCGLLHGLGFAGALGELGLPAGRVAWALASFNVGIEAAQLGVVALVLGAARLTSSLPKPPVLPRLAPQAMGAMAAAWVFDRVTTLVS